nr:hypothetical protein Iba_chr08dCG9030 [Ipomoea batatas]
MPPLYSHDSSSNASSSFTKLELAPESGGSTASERFCKELIEEMGDKTILNGRRGISLQFLIAKDRQGQCSFMIRPYRIHLNHCQADILNLKGYLQPTFFYNGPVS